MFYRFNFGHQRYTTCIIWLAFLPIYFGTANTNEVCAVASSRLGLREFFY
jgi:hypothetical protein